MAPVGRPKGAQNKFSKRFLKDFINDWNKHGLQTLESVRVNQPSTYLRVAVGLLVKDEPLEVSITHVPQVEALKSVEDNFREIMANVGLEKSPNIHD